MRCAHRHFNPPKIPELHEPPTIIDRFNSSHFKRPKTKHRISNDYGRITPCCLRGRVNGHHWPVLVRLPLCNATKTDVWVCARPVLVFTVEGRRFTDTCIVFFTTSSTLSSFTVSSTIASSISSTLSVTPVVAAFSKRRPPPRLNVRLDVNEPTIPRRFRHQKRTVHQHRHYQEHPQVRLGIAIAEHLTPSRIGGRIGFNGRGVGWGVGCEEVEEEDGDEAGEDAEEPGLTVERHSYGFVWVRYDKKR